MKKLLIFAIFGLMFAITTQARDKGYSPDVGYEQTVVSVQPVVIMPAMVVSAQFAFTQVSANLKITPSAAIRIPDVTITAYHNPDYGLCLTLSDININNTARYLKFVDIGKKVNKHQLQTTRHVLV